MSVNVSGHVHRRITPAHAPATGAAAEDQDGAEKVTRTQLGYLRTLLELEEAGLPRRIHRVARQLERTNTTVHLAAHHLRHRGLVDIAHESSHLALTPAGRALAVTALRRHRLVECFLHDVLRHPWPLLHHDAARLEPVVGEPVMSRIDRMLGYPTRSPYGNPVPERDDPQWRALDSHLRGVRDLAMLTLRGTGDQEARIAWLDEGVQSDSDLLERLERAGILPGARVVVMPRPGRSVTLTTPSGGQERLPPATAAKIFVAA